MLKKHVLIFEAKIKFRWLALYTRARLTHKVEEERAHIEPYPWDVPPPPLLHSSSTTPVLMKMKFSLLLRVVFSGGCGHWVIIC